MKNFVLKTLSSKRNLQKMACVQSSISKSFSLKAEIIESEILKSFSSINKKFNISPSIKQPVYESIQDSSISMDYIKNKYFDTKSTNEIDQIIKVLFREEVLNLPKEKEYENLVLFIKNCKKYNYPDYLTDVKFFKNKEIRNFMLNTSLLETLSHKSSPYSLQKEFEAKIQVQNLYKLRKGEKGEKMDSITEKEFDLDKYNYMNFLAETSTFEKLNKSRKLEARNKQVLEDFKKGDSMIEKDDIGIRDEVWKNHYVEYLKKMKRKERKESLGMSKHEEPYFNDSIEQSKERIFEETSGDFTKINNLRSYITASEQAQAEAEAKNNGNSQTSQSTRMNNTDGVHVSNFATYINDGTNEPFPFYGKDDYPIEEFFDETINLPDKDILFTTLTAEGQMSPLPPKIADWLDRCYADAQFWHLFTSVVHHQLFLDQHKAILLTTIAQLQKINWDIPNFSMMDLSDIPLPPSVIDYYNLLPKWARDHPTMKTVVRGLEYHQPWTSYKEKVMAVNWTLQVLIGKDKTYNELMSMSYQADPEELTMDKLPALLEFDEEDSRNILQHPEDEATDDEEMEIISTAEDVRAIEKEEEEERKKKKREEGRAKRAAEEAKQAAAESKNKEDVEKKKKEEADKKKKEETAAPEEEEAEEIDTQETRTEAKTEDKELEDRMFTPSNRSKRIFDKQEETMNIYDTLYDKMKGIKKTQNDSEDIEVTQIVDEQEYKKVYGMKKLSKEDESLSFSDELEAFRRQNREQKNVVENKKEKIVSILRDLRSSTNLKAFDEKVKIIKRNLDEVTDKNYILELKNMKGIEKKKENEIEDKSHLTADVILYPLSLLNSNEFSDAEKEIISKYFNEYITDLPEVVKSANIILIDQKKDSQGNKVSETNDDDIMSKISTFENESKETGEGFDIDADYKESLKDEDTSVDVSEDLGLQDAYYKPKQDLDHRLKTEDPIPFEFYLNEDGFWNNYIAFHRKRINPGQFVHKPFNPYMKNIKKNENI